VIDDFETLVDDDCQGKVMYDYRSTEIPDIAPFYHV
jgi:hypothetical protein